MLFIPPIGDLDAQSGLWSREQLLEMDSRFVAALEAAFAKGLESRAAAAATVWIGGMAGRVRSKAQSELLGTCFATGRERCRPRRFWRLCGSWFPAFLFPSACGLNLSGDFSLGLGRRDDGTREARPAGSWSDLDAAGDCLCILRLAARPRARSGIPGF